MFLRQRVLAWSYSLPLPLLLSWTNNCYTSVKQVNANSRLNHRVIWCTNVTTMPESTYPSIMQHRFSRVSKCINGAYWRLWMSASVNISVNTDLHIVILRLPFMFAVQLANAPLWALHTWILRICWFLQQNLVTIIFNLISLWTQSSSRPIFALLLWKSLFQYLLFYDFLSGMIFSWWNRFLLTGNS